MDPLMFLVYIKDFPLPIEFSKILFADDTKCHRKICNTEDFAKVTVRLECLFIFVALTIRCIWHTKMLFTELPPKIIHFLLTWRQSTCYYISS